jgi:tripartite-type tricarboxylate transporter receptor subunit TctC
MGPAVLDLMSGQVQVLFASVPSIVKQKPDRLRPIAMAEKKRSALLPDLPTIDESGVSGFAVANWAGLLAPAGLDTKIVKTLHDEIVAILATPEMKEQVKKLGYDLIESSPEQFAAELSADIKRWGPVAKQAGLSIK